MNDKNKEKDLQKEIENEINNMTLEELLYLQMNPNFYLYSKLSQKINNLKKLEEEINLIQEDLNSIKNKNIEDRSILQKQFENYYSNFT